MTYTATDPRSQMTGTTGPAPNQPNAAAHYVDFTTTEPDEITEHGSRVWWVRGQNFVLAYAIAMPGEVFERLEHPDEYVALCPKDPAGALVSAGGSREVVDGAAVLVLPPGHSRIEITRPCEVVRLFSAASPELLARARNALDYAQHHAHVADFAPWPESIDGPRLRVYRVADHPQQPGRFGRLVRCSTFMINLFDPDLGPRDPATLSPHHHDDFEQCSLAVDGQWRHHIRSPWTPNLAQWRADEHVTVASPSVAIIPPPAVHTSQSVGHGRNQLVDIFCPPRHDFSARPGWVINEDEYPVPDRPGAV